MKPNLRVQYIGQWRANDELLLTAILEQKYNLAFVGGKGDNVDVVVGFYGAPPKQPANVVTIALIGENWRPVPGDSDLTIGFDYLEDQKYLRIPLWYLERPYCLEKYIHRLKDSLRPGNAVHDDINVDRFLREIQNRRKILDITHKIYPFGICASHKGKAFMGIKEIDREVIFNKLDRYKKVYSPCIFMNNMDRLKPNTDHAGVLQKYEFYEKCKFVITYENSSYPGYETEKIFDAFMGRAVPIYYGSDTIANDFNKDAFINRDDFKSDEDMLAYIRHIDNHDQEYLKLLNTPIFTEGMFKRINTDILSAKIYRTIDEKLKVQPRKEVFKCSARGGNREP